MQRPLRPGWIVALALGAAAACAPPAPLECGEETCSGCCDEEGRCVAVADQAYAVCGAGGAACRSCLPDEDCVKGQCQVVTDAGVGSACNAQSCQGCCEGDTCVAYAAQTDQACGAGGATCAACLQGTVCDLGTCAQTADAGATCGRKGDPCCAGGNCYLGLSCQGGVCTPSTGGGTDGGSTPDGGAGASPVGAACTQAAQCQTGQCQIAGFQGGYCTKDCASDAECPAGAVCGDAGGQRVCLAACPQAGSASTCRSGYVCDKRTTLGGAGACVPGCLSAATCGVASCDGRGFCCGADGFACCDGSTCDTGFACDGAGYCRPGGGVDAGTAPSGIGATCGGDGACQSGSCAEEDSGGNASCPTGPCWPGGYCIADCTQSSCPSGSSCSPYFAANSLCFENCPVPGSQGTCRPGYVCDRNWIPSSSQAICIDACNSKADCASPTDTLECVQGFCCGKTFYRCCGGVGGTCPHGGTCGTDGYCQ